MTFKVRKFWNDIFGFSQDNTLTKIDYNRVEAGLHVSLKQRYCILGHCEQIHSYEYRLTRLPRKEGKEKLKSNPQVYTTQESKEVKRVKKRLKITLRHTLPKKV